MSHALFSAAEYKVKLLIIAGCPESKNTYLTGLKPEKSLTQYIAYHKVTRTISDKVYTANIWDAAGIDQFSILPKNYTNGVVGIIAIFDPSSNKSFSNLQKKIKKIRDLARDIPVTLIGHTPVTQTHETLEITAGVASEYAQTIGASYTVITEEKSSRYFTASNIEHSLDLFLPVAQQFKQSCVVHEEKSAPIKLSDSISPHRHSSCCL
jgi:GTPase SAR1 family protein